MATSIDNAGEERNCCFNIPMSRWPWCREDQRAYWLATGPSDGACLAKDRPIGMTPPDVPVILRWRQGVLFLSRHFRDPGTRPAPLHRSAPLAAMRLSTVIPPGRHLALGNPAHKGHELAADCRIMKEEEIKAGLQPPGQVHVYPGDDTTVRNTTGDVQTTAQDATSDRPGSPTLLQGKCS